MSALPLPLPVSCPTFAASSQPESAAIAQGEAWHDQYSDRLWVDLPPTADQPVELGQSIRELARDTSVGRVVLFGPARLESPLGVSGFRHEATIPGYYEGKQDCAVMRLALDPERSCLADEPAAERVESIFREDAGPSQPRRSSAIDPELAKLADAPAIAELIGETFAAYPTPSNDPSYVARAIDRGVPFRLVRDHGRLVACASADLVEEAKTAELTDCATRPDHRGRGYMQAILEALMEDLRQRDYPTAFTLARARVPGVNVAFQRLGFTFRGRLHSSVRIGTGIEDMNVWSRFLDEDAAA